MSAVLEAAPSASMADFAIRIDRTLQQMTRLSYGYGAEAARMLGVSRVTVHQWRQGACYPSVARLIEIAELSGVSLDYLLLGRGSIPASWATRGDVA